MSATTAKTTSKSKTPAPNWKRKYECLERSIVLFVLANPSLEDEIVRNYLDRKGYVVQEEQQADRRLRLHGIKLGPKHEAWRARQKAEAVKLHEQAQKIRELQS